MINNKKNKCFLIILLILFFTGCSANANIKMNYNGTISENIDINNFNKEIKYGDKTINYSIELLLKKYQTALNVGKYDTNIYTGEDVSGVKISRNHDNICTFINNSIFSQYVYEKMECAENEFYYEIKNTGNLVKNTDRYDTWLAPDNINITISLPVLATENNADEVNDSTYIWKYNKYSPENKTFYLKISKSALKEYEEKYNNKEQTKKIIKYTIIAVLSIVIIIALGIIGNKLYKKNQENKLDY